MKHTNINNELQLKLGMVRIGGSAYTIGDAAALLAAGVDFLEERDKLKAINADLLEALQKVRQDINWMLNEKKHLNEFVFDYIDAAIAKAEVEQ